MQNTQQQTQEIACGCGRSPNGQCIGWHSLTEEQYWEKLRDYGRSTMSTHIAGVDELYG